MLISFYSYNKKNKYLFLKDIKEKDIIALDKKKTEQLERFKKEYREQTLNPLKEFWQDL